MNKHLHPLFLLFFAMVIIACKPKEMTKDEIRTYIQDTDNGIKKEYADSSGLKMEAYLIRRELIYDTTQPAKQPDSLKYLMVAFSKKGREALASSVRADNYLELVQNLSFGAGKYCRLIVNQKDTLQVSNYSFSNNYGTSPANNLLLIFNAPTINSDLQLDVDELGFNTGDAHFIFKQSDIKNFYNIKVN